MFQTNADTRTVFLELFFTTHYIHTQQMRIIVLEWNESRRCLTSIAEKFIICIIPQAQDNYTCNKGMNYCIHKLWLVVSLVMLMSKCFPATSLRRYVPSSTSKLNFYATTVTGLEQVLAQELKRIGVQNMEIVRNGVYFDGNNWNHY